MILRRLFFIAAFVATGFAFANEQTYIKLNQEYENTLQLLSDSGLQEKHVSPNPVTAQTLSKFKEIFAEYSVGIKQQECQKNSGNSIFNIKNRYANIPFQISNAQGYMTGPGNTVVPFSGEFINTETDLSLPSRGDIGFTFVRTYSSYNKSDIGIGVGWRHNYDLWLSRSNDTIVLHLNSRYVVFSKKGNNWISGQGNFYDLKEVGNGVFYIFTPDLTRYKFEPSGEADKAIFRLAEIASRHGKWTKNVIKISYLPRTNRIDFITDPFGNKIDFYYNQSGHLAAVATPFSFVRYFYADNTLIQVAYPDRKNYIGSNKQYVKYSYNKDFMTGKQFAGMPFEFKIEYDKQMRVAAIGPVSGANRNMMWNFIYNGRSTTAKAPFPLPQNIYSFNSGVHPSLPNKIERPALNAVSSLEFNKDGLLTKRVSPIGRVDIFEYDSSNVNRLFQANQIAERTLPATGMYADFSEKGVEYKYHSDIAFPVEKIYYQCKNGKRQNIKTETSAYRNSDLTLSEVVESGNKTLYWQNIYGEPAVTLCANGSATISLYSKDCSFSTYEFQDGCLNNPGYLSKKIVTDDVVVIKQYFNILGVKHDLPSKGKSVYQEVQYSYSPDGKLIRSKNALSDNFSVINSYGDIIYSYSNAQGITISQYTSWGKPQYVLHQFVPGSDKQFTGENVFGIQGRFYRESFEYDKFTLLHRHFKTNETFTSGTIFQPFIYERYPSGKVRSITTPEGISRVDERNPQTGLLEKQYVLSTDGKIALLNSDFTYYQDGIIKSVKNHLGGISTNLIDGFGNVYAEINPLGVTTQKQINVLGQETTKWSYKDGKELARAENIYNDRNLLDSVRIFRYYGGGKDIIEAKKYLYDEMGNVIAERGAQENSWTYYQYDALERKIATLSPGGDIKLSIYGNYLLYCEMTILKNQNNGKQQRFGIYFEYDDCGRKIKETPVTHWGKLAEQRTIEYGYDITGNQIRIISTGLSTTEKAFNTLGKITSEKQIPHSTQAGEKTSETIYKYNFSGQLIEKIVNNDALALVNTNSGIVPEHKKAPQITKFFFDTLTHSTKTIQPDGLVQEKIYDSRSLPVKMKWYNEFEPTVILREFDIQYSILGQCLAVTDTMSGKVIRRHTFDELGNCIQSVDIDYQGKEVVLNRNFDSVGAKLEESVKYGDKIFPVQKFSYNLKAGLIRKEWLGLHPTSLKYWQSEMFKMDSADRLSAITLDDANEPFAKWHYLGSLPVSRTVKESGVSNSITYNEFLEPESLTIQRNISGQIIGNLQYGYGAQGQAEFTSSRLISETTGKAYDFSTYSSFDSFRRLIAQNAEQVLPFGGNWQQRAKTIFADPSQTNLQALQTQRMKYDQTNNIWIMYNGGFFNTAIPAQFSQKQNPFFISPAKPITLNGGKVQDMDLKELASNRDVTTAYFADNEALKAKVQKYDKLGCLVEFEGTYWNGFTRRHAIWKLTYDPFGRLAVMKGYAPEDSNFDNIKKDDLLAELHFSYDSENRRIRKEVIDSCSHKKKDITFTVYTGIHQALVFTCTNNKISLQEQYLWNPGSQELLMATMPEKVAQGKNSIDTQRYYFQQDKGYNIIFTSKIGRTGFETVSASSYLGFGKNATRAEITEIRSSEAERYKKYAYDKTLQNIVPGCWYGNSKKLHHIELQLAGSDNLSTLKIWTANKFPKTFAVFVLPPYQHFPSANSLRELITKAKDHLAAIVEHGKYYNKKKLPDWESPYNIPLLDKKGDRVVIVWDTSCNIEVREFEVTKVPNNPGSIAFAGQWLDRETDMYYQINRYRIAGANKFISPDPLGYFDGNNLYTYAHNNPLEWHDPDGRFAHVLLGAVGGALINSGVYAVQCWITGEEFSWAELAIRAGTGALAGGIAAATFGAVNPLLAGWGFNATANIITSAATAGFTSGFTSGVADTLSHGGDVIDALKNGLTSGGWGAAGGAIGGGVLSYTGASFLGTVFAGAVAGGTTNSVRSAWDAYSETRDWSEAGRAALEGLGKGSITGALIAGGSWGIGRVTERIIPLKGYPEHMTDPREKGILIRTKSGEREYGGLPAKPGYQRQHIKPLSLGGRDVPSNIEYMKTELHSTNPALGGGPQNAHPGTYVNSKSMGTIFY